MSWLDAFFQGNKQLPSVASHAALRATVGTVGSAMMAASRSTPLDGGGGVFAWVATASPPADNGGTIIVPPQGGGYWQRVFSGAHDVKWFGAKGDNSTDDTAAIQAAINAAHALITGSNPQGGADVLIPTGYYRVSTSLLIYPFVGLVGHGGGSVNNSPSTIVATAGFTGAAGETGTPPVIRFADRTQNNYGAKLENLSINVSLFGSAIVGVDWSSGNNGLIRNVAVIGNPPGPGIGSGVLGFKVTDDNGAITNAGLTSTFFNTFLNCSATYVEIGLHCKTGTVGGMAANDFITLLVTGCCKAIRLESYVSSMGLSFRNGYLNPKASPPAGAKAIEYVGTGRPYLDVVFDNVEIENFPTAPDLPMVNQTIRAALGYPEPETVQLVDGMITSRSERRIIVGNVDTPGLGETSSNPIAPAVTHGCQSLSFWAKVSSGTTLTQGVANTFRYFTQIGAAASTTIPDLVLRCHAKAMGGLVQPASFAGVCSLQTASWTGGQSWNAYDISIYVGTTFTLTSDLVFFIDAMQPAALSNFNRLTGGYD
jgi:hypothetical protein